MIHGFYCVVLISVAGFRVIIRKKTCALSVLNMFLISDLCRVSVAQKNLFVTYQSF